MGQLSLLFTRREFIRRLTALISAGAFGVRHSRAWSADSRLKSAVLPLKDAFTVGGISYPTLQAAFDAVPVGGTIIVKGASVFNDQAGKLSKNNVTITTDAGTARFRKKIVNDKGCFHLAGNNTSISNIEFEAMHSIYSGNAAGIRLEGKGLSLSHCKFIACDDGILTSNAQKGGDGQYNVGGPGSITIDHCLFDSCGAGDGQTHGIYIGYGIDAVLTVTNSTFQYTYVGHLLKSRAYSTKVDNCLFIKGTASRCIDQCAGGNLVVTNSTFYQDDNANNPSFMDISRPPAGSADAVNEPQYPTNSVTVDNTNTFRDSHTGTKYPILWVNSATFSGLVTVTPPSLTGPYPGNSAPVLPARYPAEPSPKGAWPKWRGEGALTLITSWASAPLQRWVEIANTRMDQLVPSLNPKFTEPLNYPFSTVLSAWNGAAFDDATGKFYICGAGGHGTMNNGQYEYNAETFKWRIAMQPSSYNMTDWNNSNALYVAAGLTAANRHGFWDMDTGYYPPPGYTGTAANYVPFAYVWDPPGLIPVLPTAQHTYGGTVFVPGLGVVNTLGGGPKLYDPVAGTARYISVIPIGGAKSPAKHDTHTYWDAPSGKVYVMTNAGYDYFNVFPYDPFTDTRYADVGHSGLYIWSGSQSTPIYGTRKMFFWNQSTFSAWIIDFSTTPPMPIVVPPLYEPESPLTYNATGLFGTDGIRAICHCPEAGVVAVCASGRTVVINPDTGAVTTLDTGGTAVLRATLRKTGIRNGTWGRFRYYPARKALVLLASTDENVKVMRMG